MKRHMKKLLLLDADVVIDLHTLGLFEKVAKSYDLKVTREVLRETKYYLKGNKKIPIDIRKMVTTIEDVDVNFLKKVVLEEKEARLRVDQGEATSIAYIVQEVEEITFCTCDRAAITLMSYMELEHKAVSMEAVLRSAGHYKKLLPRHLESHFKEYVKDGKALRIQFKKLI